MRNIQKYLYLCVQKLYSCVRSFVDTYRLCLCVPSRISFPLGCCPCVIARAFMCTRQLDVYLHVYRVDIYK